jgi:serine protease Do
MLTPPLRRRDSIVWLFSGWLGVLSITATLLPSPAAGSSRRQSPIVQAVNQAKPSIVNINGHKTVQTDDATSDGTRRVNGMGTGVVVDERGYVITNYHVVEGVARIHVTLYDGTEYMARLVANDPHTDLAIIHVPVKERLPLMKIGTSSDLMEGERVVAIGNAYGYPHTVTCGFISALKRSVQVSDDQKYYDLIQTDASINPGNSGGPLLNVDGEMIGINVAVRVGAQGIGFAIPVDRAMEVAADLMSVERIKGAWHGIEGEENTEHDFVVKSVRTNSPAADVGVRPGDVIRRAKSLAIHRQLDLERSMLDVETGNSVPLDIQRGQQSVELKLVLASAPQQTPSPSDRYWQVLGARLQPVDDAELKRLGSPYNGGLRVVELRSDGPAAQQGIRKGDVLVGMHRWETISLENVNYILNRPDLQRAGRVKFYVVRGAETLYGHLPLYR